MSKDGKFEKYEGVEGTLFYIRPWGQNKGRFKVCPCGKFKCNLCSDCARSGHNNGRGYANPKMSCTICGKDNLCKSCGIRMISRIQGSRFEYRNQLAERGLQDLQDTCTDCFNAKCPADENVRVEVIVRDSVLELRYEGKLIASFMDPGRIYPKNPSSSLSQFYTPDLRLRIRDGVKLHLEIDENAHKYYPEAEDFGRCEVAQSYSEEAICFIRVDVKARKGHSTIQDAQTKRIGHLVLAWIKKLSGKKPKGWVGVHYVDYASTNKHVVHAKKNCGRSNSLFYDWVGESDTDNNRTITGEDRLLTAVDNAF